MLFPTSSHGTFFSSDLRNGEATSDDLLSLLLASNMEHCRGDGDSGAGGGITTDDVNGECKLFYFVR